MIKLAHCNNINVAQISPFNQDESSRQSPPLSDRSRMMWIENLKLLSDVKNVYSIQKILNEHDRLFGVTPDLNNKSVSPKSQAALFNQFCIEQGIVSPKVTPSSQGSKELIVKDNSGVTTNTQIVQLSWLIKIVPLAIYRQMEMPQKCKTSLKWLKCPSLGLMNLFCKANTQLNQSISTPIPTVIYGMLRQLALISHAYGNFK